MKGNEEEGMAKYFSRFSSQLSTSLSDPRVKVRVKKKVRVKVTVTGSSELGTVVGAGIEKRVWMHTELRKSFSSTIRYTYPHPYVQNMHIHSP